MAQIGNAFACRTERNRGRFLGWLSNPSLLRGIAIEVVILLGLVYIPPLARFIWSCSHTTRTVDWAWFLSGNYLQSGLDPQVVSSLA